MTQAWVGLVLGVFKPTFPPVVPTLEAVWEGLVATNADYSMNVPSVIEVGLFPSIPTEAAI